MWVLVVRRACLSLSNNNSPTVTRPCMKMPITNVLPPPPIPPFSSVRRSRFFAGDVEWKMKRLSNFSNSLNAGWNFFFRERISSRRKRRKFGCKVNEKQREIKCSTCSFSFLLRFFLEREKSRDIFLDIFRIEWRHERAGHGSINFNVY